MAHYKATAAQMRCIHALGNRAGMDIDDLRGIAYRVSGTDSLSHLTSTEACRVIDELKTRAGQRPGIAQDSAPGMATAAQQRMICRLERELGWYDQPARLRGWLLKYYGREEVRWLTVTQATNAIDALKAMLAGGRGQRPIYVDPETGEIVDPGNAG